MQVFIYLFTYTRSIVLDLSPLSGVPVVGYVRSIKHCTNVSYCKGAQDRARVKVSEGRGLVHKSWLTRCKSKCLKQFLMGFQEFRVQILLLFGSLECGFLIIW